MKKVKILKFVAALILVPLLIYLFQNWDIPVRQLGHLIYQIGNRSGAAGGGSIEIFTFNSQVLNGVLKEVKLYLPLNYDDGDSYPVLYLFHGFPGDDSDWILNAGIKSTLDGLIRDNDLPPIIVVFPDANGPIIHDGEYLNATLIDQPMEDYILEVVSIIDRKYKTIKERKGRGIGGLSSGAYGAMNIGLHHNDQFAYIISHSGYFINNERVTNRLLGRDEEARFKNNPLDYIRDKTLDSYTFIYFDIGNLDAKEFIKENEEMDSVLKQKGIQHEFNITPGWHDWNLWRKNVVTSLRFLGKNLKTLR